MPRICCSFQRRAASIAVLLMLIGTAELLFAGTTGKIAGSVKDKENGEALVSATVSLKGMKRGTVTDRNGEFFITNVQPGTYEVEFSLIGYARVTMTNVRVLIDETTNLNVTLQKSEVELQTIVVSAERPLIEPQVTNKVTSISAEEIQNLPVTSTQDILNMQAGVVQVEGRFNKINGFEDRGIDQTHVRGGRNGEIAYMVDGMYVEDAIYAGMGTFINRGAVEEMKVEVGGFNAEYGEAQAAVVNIVTKEAATQYTGSLEASTSGWANYGGIGNFEPVSQSDALRQFHSVLGTLGGPIPGIPDLSLFVAGEQSYRRYAVMEFDNITYDPTIITDPTSSYFGRRIGDTASTYAYGAERLAHPYDRFAGWQAFGFYKTWDVDFKLTYKPASLMKINITNRMTDRSFRNYAFTWQYAENAQHIVSDKTDQQGITFRHQVSNTTFYTVNLNRFWKSRVYYVPGLAGDILGPGVHASDWNHNGIPAPQDPADLWAFDPHSPDYPNPQSYTGWFANPLQITGYDSTRGVYVYSGATTQYWTQNYQQQWGGKADLTSQLTKGNELKVGLEFRKFDVFFRELQFPWSESPFPENYLEHPIEASAYVQDEADLGRLILNLGGRVDFSKSGGRIWEDPKNPTTAIVDAPDRFQISPRLGFGYRITDNTTFHFNYGHFFQVPEYRNLYLGTSVLDANRGIIGNPQLGAQKTISYEFGIKHSIGDFWAFDVTVWTKALTGQSGSVNIKGFDPDSIGAYSYYVLDNYDYGTAKGVDVTITKRFSSNYGATVNYTYSVAKANRYYSWTGYWNGETADTEPKRETLMPYDQTHKLDANIYFRFPEGFGPTVLGFNPLERWYFNFVITYESGYPYTPVVGSRAGDPMSARSPDRSQVDATIRREFRLFDRFTLGVFARIRNLFDQKNVLYVYPSTGSATKPDPTASGYSTYYDRPDFYDIRREIDLGLRIEF
jgi:outer membrane receptor protein involved in Fe transport